MLLWGPNLQRNGNNRKYACLCIYTQTYVLSFLFIQLSKVFLCRHIIHGIVKTQTLRFERLTNSLPIRVTGLKGSMPICAGLFLCLYYYKCKKHESPPSCRLVVVASRIGLRNGGGKGGVSRWCLQTSPRQHLGPYPHVLSQPVDFWLLAFPCLPLPLQPKPVMLIIIQAFQMKPNTPV